MASDKDSNGDRDRDAEIERYREAAMQTLDQLQWCINYLHRIRKDSIATGLERNRSRILERLSGPRSTTG
jgi:hypothetical protein